VWGERVALSTPLPKGAYQWDRGLTGGRCSSQQGESGSDGGEFPASHDQAAHSDINGKQEHGQQQEPEREVVVRQNGLQIAAPCILRARNHTATPGHRQRPEERRIDAGGTLFRGVRDVQAHLPRVSMPGAMRFNRDEVGALRALLE